MAILSQKISNRNSTRSVSPSITLNPRNRNHMLHPCKKKVRRNFQRKKRPAIRETVTAKPSERIRVTSSCNFAPREFLLIFFNSWIESFTWQGRGLAEKESSFGSAGLVAYSLSISSRAVSFIPFLQRATGQSIHMALFQTVAFGIAPLSMCDYRYAPTVDFMPLTIR